jgi:D-arabinose 1-dehydrogenase-like Zn-dependent alcohol dehydrogenase
MVAYADATQLIPNGLSYDQAAPIFCAGYTIYSGLRLVAGQHGDRSPDGGGGGGADVILATSNSYKATADAIKGLRPDGRVILMGVSSTETLTVSPEILFKRVRIIGSTQNDREHLYEALDYVAKCLNTNLIVFLNLALP